MKVLFISGPLRGIDVIQTYRFRLTARVAMFKSCIVGWAPLCPHTMFYMFDKGIASDITTLQWFNITLELLSRCDAMMVLPGYEQSEGAMKEVELAKLLNIPIFNYGNESGVKTPIEIFGE